MSMGYQNGGRRTPIRSSAQQAYYAGLAEAYKQFGRLPVGERIGIWARENLFAITVLLVILISGGIGYVIGTAEAQDTNPTAFTQSNVRLWLLILVNVIVGLAGLLSLYTIFFSKNPTSRAADFAKVVGGFYVGAANSLVDL